MTKWSSVRPVDDVHGPVQNETTAASWRKQGLKVTSRTDKGGNTTYARVGAYANKTERHGLLRRKRNRVDLDNVRYQLGKSAFGITHE